MIDWIRDSDCGVAIDLRQHPVVIGTWHGTATVGLIDGFYRWSDATVAAAIAAEQRLLRIADLSHARLPAGPVRKRVFEHAGDDLAAEVTIATYVVAQDPAVRGMVSALRWVGGGAREPEIIMVERVEQALERAIERLCAERIPVPPGLDPVRYEPPRLGVHLI